MKTGNQKTFDKYINLAKEVHRGKKWWGGSLLPFIGEIDSLMNDLGAKTLLDDGCGKAQGHPEHWSGYAKYDPAYPPFSEKPVGKFDVVICTDVMEHVPECCVDYVLREIFDYSKIAVFLAIATKPARGRLSNGENKHLTVKPIEWWDGKIKELSENTNIPYILHEGMRGTGKTS